ncbi:MAG: hypothetical protein H0Z32_02030 [Bacillaceae bacterium]|nr:hypothetical protein [Bacillaceae bacterium]
MAGTMWWNFFAGIIAGLYVFVLSIGMNSFYTSLFRSVLIFLLIFFIMFVIRSGLSYILKQNQTNKGLGQSTDKKGTHSDHDGLSEKNNHFSADPGKKMSQQEAERTAEVLRNLLNHDQDAD